MMNPVIVEKIAKVERQRNERRIQTLQLTNQAAHRRGVSLKPSATVTGRIAKFVQRIQGTGSMLEAAKE